MSLQFVEIARIADIRTGSTPTQFLRPADGNEGIPFVTPSDFAHKDQIFDTERVVSSPALTSLKGRLVPANSTCVTCIGSTLGKTGFVKNQVMTNQQINSVTAVPGKAQSRYLYYAILNGSAQLKDIAGGSASPILNKSDFGRFLVPDFDLQTQHKIADVLGALDDKIAANQRVLAIQSDLILSHVSRASRGQSTTKLNEVANSITRGVAPKYSEEGALVLNQKCIREKVVSLDEARRLSNLPVNKSKLVENSDVLVNSTGMGTLGRAARWTQAIDDVTVDSHVTIVKFDRNAVDPDFAGAVLVSMESRIEDLAEGSTGQTELRRQLLGTIPLPLPEITVQKQIGAVIRDLDANANGLARENQVLVNTRDELLPLLMNGKITVAEAQEEVEALGVYKHAEGAGDV